MKAPYTIFFIKAKMTLAYSRPTYLKKKLTSYSAVIKITSYTFSAPIHCNSKGGAVGK